MDLRINVDTKRAQGFVNKYNAESPDRMRRIVKILSFSVERGSKQAVTQLGAVDTGLLRSTINVIFGKAGLEGIVEPHTDYAGAVHEGTGSNSRQGRRPFMEIGADVAFGEQASVVEALKSDIYGLI